MPLQLLSTVTEAGVVEISIGEAALPELKADDVLIRVEAAPINPSDLGLLLGAGDASTAQSIPGDRPGLALDIPEERRSRLATRVGKAMPVGNEGAGVVVKAGDSPAAQAMLGKVVGAAGGAMYSQYKVMQADRCTVFPEGVSPQDGASGTVNPLTVLGFLETMRAEGHTALVHTAAASNLGQMLAKACLQDGIGLVNVVRKEEQVEILKAIGSQHVVNSSSPTFIADLTEAIVATGATLAFDATGGGDLASQILSCMEVAVNQNSGAAYSIYGNNTHKQLYIYGGLQSGPTVLERNFGLAWGIGGWLLIPFMAKIDAAKKQSLMGRVAAEITTTFKSTYSREVSLAEALDPDIVKEYAAQATGKKTIINPNKDLPAAEF